MHQLKSWQWHGLGTSPDRKPFNSSSFRNHLTTALFVSRTRGLAAGATAHNAALGWSERRARLFYQHLWKIWRERRVLHYIKASNGRGRAERRDSSQTNENKQGGRCVLSAAARDKKIIKRMRQSVTLCVCVCVLSVCLSMTWMKKRNK